MFHYETDASKAAFVTLAHHLKNWGFQMIDAQVTTRHLLSLGAKEVPRKVFLKKLREAVAAPTLKGKWDADVEDSF